MTEKAVIYARFSSDKQRLEGKDVSHVFREDFEKSYG